MKQATVSGFKPETRTPCRRLRLPNRRLITCEEFERLLETEVFAPDERLELLAGTIVQREIPMRTPHASAIALLTHTLLRILPENTHLRVQLPLTLSPYDQPFPDLAVVSGSPRDYAERHPDAALLVVEVAEASLKTDREIKGSLYASVGIPEYWILNLKERVLEVYREPAPNARAPYGAAYQTALRLEADQSIVPLTRPDVSIPVAELLP